MIEGKSLILLCLPLGVLVGIGYTTRNQKLYIYIYVICRMHIDNVIQIHVYTDMHHGEKEWILGSRLTLCLPPPQKQTFTLIHINVQLTLIILRLCL